MENARLTTKAKSGHVLLTKVTPKHRKVDSKRMGNNAAWMLTGLCSSPDNVDF